ncbi:Arogenate dehydratase/prephenate dehydratase 1, chloroplastic [Glycine soja]
MVVGLPGAYTEDAALKAYPKCETVPCEDFETSFKAVESWLVDKVVLPIKSSIGGSINRNYDLLLGHKLYIVGEVQLLINHCLLGLPGVRKEDLKAVMSHPQGQKMITDEDVNITHFLILARDPRIPRNDMAYKIVRDTRVVNHDDGGEQV